jgi:hypothetical protein
MTGWISGLGAVGRWSVVVRRSLFVVRCACFICSLSSCPAIFFCGLVFRIMVIARNPFQIFGFKGLTCKILRNNDLAAPGAGFRVSRFQGFKVTGLARADTRSPSVRFFSPNFFYTLVFRIMVIARNSFQIFGFKGLTCKILRNNDLAA